ncbi:MAG: hypothetical protein OEY01_03875 [Desulfobulbaceae bacterium]|nr:hypothetical protein [Desulfobulbaceae bacterium]
MATLSPGERRKAKIAILKGMSKGERRKAKLELMRAKKEGLFDEKPAPVKHRPPTEPDAFNLEDGEATFASALAPTPRTWPKSAKGVCPVCLEKGHTAKTCPKTEVPKLSKQELELIGHEESLKRFGSYPKVDNRRFFIYHPHKNFCYRMWQTATSDELTSRLSKEEIDRLQIRKPVFREGVRIVRLG